MNKKTLAKLEYNKIIEQLIEHASSFSGKELCRRLKPMTDISAIRSAQDETAAAFTRIVKKGRPSFSGCNPVNDSIRRLEIGGVLGSGELLRICKLLETAGRARAYGRHDNADEMEDCLDGYFEQLNPVTILVNEIRRCVIDEDEISDDASPGLKHVRRAMNQINDKVHATLSNMVNGSLRTYLQDPIITMRGDRYCIPVKAEYRSQVSGMIHDQSATGSTLFIEPMAVVKLNNDLKELYGQEQEEIQKVLARLSADAAEYTTEIHTCYTILRQLDFIFAKGALALDMNASQPIFNTEGRIHIREGRHPLLDKKNVVPITLTLGDTFDLLIVTGPNTGGKTVSLKTVGLFTLMGQAGLHIPALDRSELAVFHDVYADIRDEQSIEQSLSTFSSHMTNIVSFLKQVDEHSLVLFDELGAGTDPTEGAALATSILNYLHSRGIRTMATTHYSELKEYALTTPNVENASVEFDVATLRPTYRLSIGIPGKSNAFEISRKLGLPEFIIGRAKELLSKEQVRFEDVIANAEYHRQVAKKERELAEQARNEMISIRDQAEAEKKKLEDQREKSIRKAKDEAKRIVENAKRESEAMIAELRAMKKAGGAQEHEIQKVKKQMEKAQEALADQKEVGGEVAKSVEPGDMVHIASMDVDAIIVAPVDSKGYVQLKVGMMKMRAPLSDLRTLTTTQQMVKKEQKKLERKKSMREARVDITTRAVRQELDVRGMALDEAIPEVEKFIDDAMLSSLGEVSIIHGNGTGVLRAGIQDCLRRHPCVSSFRLGRYGEGETGVTIVSLK